MQIYLHAKRKDKNVRSYKCSTRLCQKIMFQYILMSCSLRFFGYILHEFPWNMLDYLFSLYCYKCRTNALLVPQMSKFCKICSLLHQTVVRQQKHHHLCCCWSFFAYIKEHVLLIRLWLILSYTIMTTLYFASSFTSHFAVQARVCSDSK